MATQQSPNRAYLASVLRTLAQIPLRGTSDMLEPLCEIAFKKVEREENCHLNCTLVGKEGG